MHVGLAELCLEWNDLDAAADHLRVSDELGDLGGLAQNPYRWRVAMAQLRLTEGDSDGALALLEDAERVFVSEYYPVTRPLPAQAARIHAARGRLREAGAWVRERGLSVDDDLSYVGEYEHITLARVLMAQGTRTHDPSADRGSEGAPRAPAGRRRNGWAVAQRHRDPRPAGPRPERSRSRRCGTRSARSRADIGGAGGLRPNVRRRGRADGRHARSGGEAWHRAGVRSTLARRASDAATASSARRSRPGGAAQRTGA